MSVDRLKAAGRAVVGLDPMIRYRCLYRCKVVGQSGDTVDVRPYDASLPDMARIPLRHGVPGLKVQVTPGCSVQVGFDDGRPDRPFAALWSTDAAAVRVVLEGTSVELGNAYPVDFAIKGTTQIAQLVAVMTAIGEGMTALGQTAAASACASFVGVAPLALSSNVKVGG